MEFKIKDLEEKFNKYKVDAEDIISGKIKPLDEYFGYIGDSFGEICDNIDNHKLSIYSYHDGLTEKGFNIMVENCVFAPPFLDPHKRYFLPESALFRLRQELKVQSFIGTNTLTDGVMKDLEDKLND